MIEFTLKVLQKEKNIPYFHVTEHRIISVTRLRHMRAYAKKSLRNFFKSGGFNQNGGYLLSHCDAVPSA